MATETLAVTLDGSLVEEIDRLVRARVYPDRDRAIEDALKEKLHTLRRGSLAAECGKLDPAEEQALAEEGLRGGAAWPEY